MTEVVQLVVVITLAVVFLAATVAIWLQRSPRRATMATLKVATTSPKAATTVTRAPIITLGAAPATPRSSETRARLKQTTDTVVGAVATFARRLSPPAYSTSVSKRLTLAGKDRAQDADDFFALRLVTVALFVPAFLLLSISPLLGIYRLLGFFFIATVLALGPEALLNRAVSDRQNKVRHDLPILVELLMISVEAGLGFDQALARSVSSVPGPLGEEFSRFLGEVRMGSEHKEALEAIDRRTDVDELRSFLMALVQAETFGVPIGPILRSQAVEVRVAQRQQVQEQAQKAPVKMLFPMVFCVLPALFVVVLGPAIIEIYNTLITK